MTARAAACGRAAGMRTFAVATGTGTPAPADDHGQVQVTQQIWAAARPAEVPASAGAAGAIAGRRGRRASLTLPRREPGTGSPGLDHAGTVQRRWPPPRSAQCAGPESAAVRT